MPNSMCPPGPVTRPETPGHGISTVHEPELDEVNAPAATLWTQRDVEIRPIRGLVYQGWLARGVSVQVIPHLDASAFK